MKAIVCFLISSSIVFTAIADFVTLRFSVTDESGTPVKNAKISVDTARDAIDISWFGTTELRNYTKHTKQDGQAKMTILCHDGDYTVNVSADGYYPYRKFRESCYREIVDHKTGKHDFEMQDQSYRITLRRIINPTDIAVKPQSAWYRYPKSESKVGFDLKIGDWVSPYGKGKVVDLMIEHSQVLTNGVYRCSGKIIFLSGGAYRRKKINSSSYVSEYRADTNAVYVSEYPFQNSMGGRRQMIGIAADDEYLIFRTRVVRNEKGEIVSQNYGKIYGLVRGAGEFSFKGLFFNPTPNDPNIEEKR